MRLIKLFSREYSVQYTEASIRSLGPEVRKHVPALVLSQLYVPEKNNETCCADRDEWSAFLRALEMWYKDSQSVTIFLRLFHRYGKQYVAQTKRIGALRYAKKNNQVLAQLYREYIGILNIYSAYLWMGFFLNDIYARKGKRILEEKNIDDPAIVAVLFSPVKRSGILQLQDRLSLLKHKDVRVLSRAVITEILRQFAWMSCLDLQNDPWTAGDVRSFFRTIAVRHDASMSFARAIRAAHLTKKEAQIFRMIRDLTYVKDMRDVYRRKGISNILPLFEEIGKRFGLSRHDIAYASNEEIIESLTGKQRPFISRIKARKKGFAIFWKRKKIIVTANGNAIRRLRKQIDVTKEVSRVLSGVVASKGHARGVVKIVRGIRDLIKVKKGDILIAITTHPDFVPAMQRASAIVTDEGGLTSHAAIVSRELGIPCIVGTKVATAVLRDGDRVEVDAERGIVKKIP